MTRGLRTLIRRAPFIVLLVALVAGFATTALAVDPVTVTFAVTGDPAPGATVTVLATVTINNGSALQTVKWTQTSGIETTLSNTTTNTVTVTLPSRMAFRDELITLLEEAPVKASDLPSYIPMPSPYEGGLQDRYVVAGVSPHALAEAGAISFDFAVTTTSGTYHFSTSVAGDLPWTTSTSNRNVAINVPVLLHGKTQATYNWTMTKPAGSAATLTDATTQNPEFTPDVAGMYTLTVTDIESNAPVTLTIYAGTWKGIITGQDANGRPTTDPSCMNCHKLNTPNFDEFTPWRQSGHSEIFTQNVNTPNGHYSTSCLECHTVGYDPKATNGGMDEATGFDAFVASGLLTHGEPDNWTQIIAQYPDVAKLANIQCENCHGPQNSEAHMVRDGSRSNLSSEVCGSCHGEPTRHGRYQQWQLSGHANYEVARSEGTNPSCAKCHSAQGFLEWEEAGFSNDATINVNWDEDSVHPQTCQTCHEPHSVGTTSGSPATNATVRLEGSTPVLGAGFAATDVGRGAVCMVCHNGRRGLMDDQHFSLANAGRAPHVGPQTDILMGQNMYFTTVGQRGYHSKIQDTCVNCHMGQTKPPATLSNNFGGTNHTFFASPEICSNCHSEITAEQVQGEVEAKMERLKTGIQEALLTTLQNQIRGGNAIDFGGGKVIHNASDIASVELTEVHGQQGMNVTFSDSSTADGVQMSSVKVVRPGGSSVALYSVANPNVAKAAWNYFMVESDASEGVHNPAFVNSALDVTNFAVDAVNATNTDVSIGGGPANGAGAVSCTTPYVYWVELVGHLTGNAGSVWRSDVVARDLSSRDATLRFVLHQDSGNMEGAGTVTGGAQKSFEDIVGMLGGTNTKGSLEICSDKPLLILGRTYNQSANGTFGQFFDGHVADTGFGAGQTVQLLGMRQMTGAYRTNISVTNGGTTDGSVSITLYDNAGNALTTYTLNVPAGKVVQDVEPFANRAAAPNVDWGFATVTVLSGSNFQTSAALIDMTTNDPTTIPAKQ